MPEKPLIFSRSADFLTASPFFPRRRFGPNGRWNLAFALMVLKLVLHMRQVWTIPDSTCGSECSGFVVETTRSFKVKINEMYHITTIWSSLISQVLFFKSFLFHHFSFFNFVSTSTIFSKESTGAILLIYAQPTTMAFSPQDKLMVLDLWNMANICWRPWVSETRWDFKIPTFFGDGNPEGSEI